MIADDEPWEARVRAFAKTRFWMPHHWGPRPNEKGCRAPSQFIEEFLK